MLRTNERTVFISHKAAKEIQEAMDNNLPLKDSYDNEIVECLTAEFGNGIEADIKVINTDNGPYIDAVLFHDNCDVCTLEPAYEIKGEYYFEYSGEEYVVKVDTKKSLSD